jgi:hypothetical protein
MVLESTPDILVTRPYLSICILFIYLSVIVEAVSSVRENVAVFPSRLKFNPVPAVILIGVLV